MLQGKILIFMLFGTFGNPVDRITNKKPAASKEPNNLYLLSAHEKLIISDRNDCALRLSKPATF